MVRTDKVPEMSDFVFIKSDKEFFQLKKSAILYIKGDDDFTRVYTPDKMYLDGRTMKSWLGELSKDFLQVHKSYIVNLQSVTKISGQRIFLNELELPIGRAYKQSLIQLVEGVKS